MKLRNRHLIVAVFRYFLLFSAILLGFLYFFQIMFFNTYYRYHQITALEHALSSIEKNVNNKQLDSYLNKLSLENEVCIQVVDSESNVLHYSESYKHCVRKDNQELISIINDFVKGKDSSLKFEFMNTSSNGNEHKVLVYGKKLSSNMYVFVNTSLVPLDQSLMLLKSQFVYLAVFLVILSFSVSFYFSRRIAKPILKITNESKKLGLKGCTPDFTTTTYVSELRDLSSTLSKVNTELNKAEDLRRELLANVSHDLKTPLTMIEGYAFSARDLNSGNKKKRERDLNIIIDEAERLNMLVNDVLILSELESRSNKLVLEKFNIRKFVSIILGRFAIYKDMGYTFVFDDKRDLFIEADKKSIERVIYNLIINAINYTGSDKTIKIVLDDVDDDLTIKIIDSGKGIDEKDKELVWQKYYKTNRRYRRENVGTGLGLSIVKELLEMHGFEYGIDSKKNKGSCFWFKCKIKR